MAATGPLNPLPHHVGGHPSPTEKVYRVMRAAVGRVTKNRPAAGPVGGLEDTWRVSRARTIARVLQLQELAALQAFPNRATVHLPVYEEQLAVPREDTDEQRRRAVTAAYTAKLEAIIPTIRAKLAAIDSGIDVLTMADDYATVFQFGQALASRTTPSDWGGRVAGVMPNFSTHFVLLVQWLGAPSGIPDPEKRAQVERYLNSTLPSWCDYTIQNGAGFYLDGYNDSRLDLTAFN